MVKKSRTKIYQIGIMGSESHEVNQELKTRAAELGKEIAKRGHVLLTGGGVKGVPFYAAEAAKSVGGTVVAIIPGFSPASFRRAKVRNAKVFDVIIQTGLSSSLLEKNSIGLDYLNINSCDAVIFVSGRLGTFAEFLIALKANKVIGVLDKSGGMNSNFADFAHKAGKKIITTTEPRKLIRQILKNIPSSTV